MQLCKILEQEQLVGGSVCNLCLGIFHKSEEQNYTFNECLLFHRLVVPALNENIAHWAYEYNRHGFWGKAISVPPSSINNDGSLMQ